MGTKREPGAHDCYGKAHPDEPVFTLRANDPLAPMVVEYWAASYQDSGGRVDKAKEARDCAHAMRAWRAERTSEEDPE